MANAQMGLNHQEYLRADRLAPRRSNSHSPALRRAPSPTATRRIRSPANEAWVPTVGRVASSQEFSSPMPSNEESGLIGTSPRLQSGGESGRGPSQCLSEFRFCRCKGPQRTTSERQEFPFVKFLK